jgi:leucyl-tRNA synthetase
MQATGSAGRAGCSSFHHRRARGVRDRIEVYTTRPDTLMGASFVAISPDHPLAKALERHDPEVAAFNADAAASAPPRRRWKGREAGLDTGIRVRHPFDPPGSCRSISPTSS